MSQSDAESDTSGVRLNVIHIHGVNEMSTQNVFDYFAEFAPSALEWIDDSSCTCSLLSLQYSVVFINNNGRMCYNTVISCVIVLMYRPTYGPCMKVILKFVCKIYQQLLSMQSVLV